MGGRLKRPTPYTLFAASTRDTAKGTHVWMPFQITALRQPEYL